MKIFDLVIVIVRNIFSYKNEDIKICNNCFELVSYYFTSVHTVSLTFNISMYHSGSNHLWFKVALEIASPSLSFDFDNDNCSSFPLYSKNMKFKTTEPISIALQIVNGQTKNVKVIIWPHAARSLHIKCLRN